MLIGEDGIGPFRLGMPIPADLLKEEPDKRYTARFYADAQPLEGFGFEAPPVFVAVLGGPFHAWGKTHLELPPPAHVAKRAIMLARSGKLTVAMVVIASPEPCTAKGIGVGSSYAELRRAYPAAQARMLPGLWEEPSCVVDLEPSGPVRVFFAKCGRADGGTGASIDPGEKAIRVVVAPPS
ncbi:MAG: hypothetical protein HY744_17905 [Deltaproteobacteria bacterium]|nr:hypothetical protein [Deltaproteobacteria bacterium]